MEPKVGMDGERGHSEQPTVAHDRGNRRNGIAIAIIIGLLIYLSILYDAHPTTYSALLINAVEADGMVIINAKSIGLGSIRIRGITLYSGHDPVLCNSVTYYLNGQHITHLTDIALQPGQSLTIIETDCRPPVDQVTSVAIMTYVGNFTAQVS